MTRITKALTAVALAATVVAMAPTVGSARDLSAMNGASNGAGNGYGQGFGNGYGQGFGNGYGQGFSNGSCGRVLALAAARGYGNGGRGHGYGYGGGPEATPRATTPAPRLTGARQPSPRAFAWSGSNCRSDLGPVPKITLARPHAERPGVIRDCLGAAGDRRSRVLGDAHAWPALTADDGRIDRRGRQPSRPVCRMDRCARCRPYRAVSWLHSADQRFVFVSRGSSACPRLARRGAAL